MNCEQVTGRIGDFVDGSLSSILNQAISHHLKKCQHCSSEVTEERKLIAHLANCRVPAISPAFFAQALTKAGEYHGSSDRVGISLRHVNAAACFLLGVLLTVFFQGSSFDLFSANNPTGRSIELSVAQGGQLDINLQVSVNHDIANATMIIEVPQTLRIVGYEDVNVLEWQVALKKGKNILALPVKTWGQVSHNQISHLVARLTTDTLQKDFDIKITLKSTDSLQQGASLHLRNTESINWQTMSAQRKPKHSASVQITSV